MYFKTHNFNIAGMRAPFGALKSLQRCDALQTIVQKPEMWNLHVRIILIEGDLIEINKSYF